MYVSFFCKLMRINIFLFSQQICIAFLCFLVFLFALPLICIALTCSKFGNEVMKASHDKYIDEC